VRRHLGPYTGYCLMVGGDRKIYETLGPLFATLAPEDGYYLLWGTGAGHFRQDGS
jgi:6-phosphogluconate dehydrogenase